MIASATPYAPLAVLVATTLYALADSALRFRAAFRRYRHA